MKKPALYLCLALTLVGGCKFLVKQLVDFQEYWPNGLPKSRGQLFGDKQSGEWTLSYESGRPLAKGRYENDRQVGPWIFYYENGNEQRSGAYDDKGLRTGEWLYKYEDQTPQSRGSYVADFEDGPWTFYGKDGLVTMEGQYQNGKQSGLWSFYYPGGAKKAEGIYFEGDRVGQWQVWSERGASRIQDFGGKAGVQLVRETWPDSQTVRRVGALQSGQPVGRWTSFHPNGRMRFCCGLVAGAPDGVFEARDEDGAVIAQGRFAEGAIAAGVAVTDGVSRDLAAAPLPPLSTDLEPWCNTAALDAAPPQQTLALFVGETKAQLAEPRFTPVAIDEREQPSVDKPAPVAAEVVESIDEAPTRMPAPAQPQLTVKQKKEMAQYIEEYTTGPKAGGGLFSTYAPTAGSPRPKGTGQRADLLGKPLPFDVMKGVDGEDVDLRQYRGKQRVMIVVLRGFLGEVCCYCIAQTKALAKAREKLEKANVEVLVIYPGARENEESFRELYELEFGEGPPPYRVFYDPDLELVTKLGIEGDLASPTTLIIDKQGIVQYAYVGEHRADRPATNELIKKIEGL